MTTNRTASAASIRTAADRRAAERATMTFDTKGITPDRSKNGTRTPRSVRHKGLR